MLERGDKQGSLYLEYLSRFFSHLKLEQKLHSLPTPAQCLRTCDKLFRPFLKVSHYVEALLGQNVMKSGKSQWNELSTRWYTQKGGGGRGWYFGVSDAQSVGRRSEKSLRVRFICHENFFFCQWLKHFASLPSCFSRVLLFATSSQSSPGSSVHGILQTILLESVAMPSSRGSSWPKPTSPVAPALQMDSSPSATGEAP